MVKIETTIVIEAPVEEVFAYTTDPNHSPEFYTGVQEVKDVRRLPNGGYACTTVYKLLGMREEFATETTEFVPNERIVARSQGKLEEATISVTFDRLEGEKTRVTCHEEHTFHGGFLGKLGEPFLAKYLDHAAAMTQEALKARVEAAIPAAATR